MDTSTGNDCGPKINRALQAVRRGGMTPAMVFASRLFPSYGVDETYRRRAEALAPDLAPVDSKIMTERIDVVRRTLCTRALRG